MSEVDRSEAKARLESLFAESKENNEGAGIPEVVEAVLGDDADEEITELVLMASATSTEPTKAGSVEPLNSAAPAIARACCTCWRVSSAAASPTTFFLVVAI